METERELAEILLGRIRQIIPNDPVPSYLADKYTREGVVVGIIQRKVDSPLILGALARAATCDDEEDVRCRCLEALAHVAPRFAQATLVAAIFDRDPSVRIRALELMAELDLNRARHIAHFLADDIDPDVVEFASKVVAS